MDIARGWVRVLGKGSKERRVPVDREVAALIQSYLLTERPRHRQPGAVHRREGPHARPAPDSGRAAHDLSLSPRRARVPAGHPHALRHTFGTALAEAGVDLAVLQALMGHDHVDSAAAYIHLAPQHVRRAYDAARARQRT